MSDTTPLMRFSQFPSVWLIVVRTAWITHGRQKPCACAGGGETPRIAMQPISRIATIRRLLSALISIRLPNNPASTNIMPAAPGLLRSNVLRPKVLPPTGANRPAPAGTSAPVPHSTQAGDVRDSGLDTTRGTSAPADT